MARRAPTDDKQAKAAKETAGHGGLVALVGGPENGFWYWRDEWDRHQRDSSRFVAYVETGDLLENRDTKDPHGVHLRWYGPGTVFRFDPSLVPPDCAAGKVDPIPLAYCACGERLLLPGRETCERCRVGIPPSSCLIWRPFGEAPSETPAWFAEPIADPMLDSGEPAELQPDPEPVVITQSQEPAPSDPAEVAAFVWRNVAHLYER